jgi:hypothetical protein
MHPEPPVLGERLSGVAADEVPRLGKVMLLSRRPGVRAWAARELGRAGWRSAYSWLRRALWDRDEQVRVSAVRAIRQLDVRQSAGELAALYAWSGPRVRREVLRTAGRLGRGADFSGVWSLAAADPEPGLRGLAARQRRG